MNTPQPQPAVSTPVPFPPAKPNIYSTIDQAFDQVFSWKTLRQFVVLFAILFVCAFGARVVMNEFRETMSSGIQLRQDLKTARSSPVPSDIVFSPGSPEYGYANYYGYDLEPTKGVPVVQDQNSVFKKDSKIDEDSENDKLLKALDPNLDLDQIRADRKANKKAFADKFSGLSVKEMMERLQEKHGVEVIPQPAEQNTAPVVVDPTSAPSGAASPPRKRVIDPTNF